MGRAASTRRERSPSRLVLAAEIRATVMLGLAPDCAADWVWTTHPRATLGEMSQAVRLAVSRRKLPAAVAPLARVAWQPQSAVAGRSRAASMVFAWAQFPSLSSAQISEAAALADALNRRRVRRS